MSFVDCRGVSDIDRWTAITVVLTTLLCSRSLACVLSCVFVFDTATPYAYRVSDVAWRMKSALTIWLIRPDLLVCFAADTFHLD